MERRDKIGYTVGFFVFIAIGLWAAWNPTAVDGYIAAGAGSGSKLLFADYWSRGFGLTMMGLGALALVGMHTHE
jgi:hypothetical protein